MSATVKINAVLIISLTLSQPFIHFIDGEYIHMNGETKLAFRTCDFRDKARLNSGVSLQGCVRDCFLRSWCQYAIYRFSTGICALTETDINLEALTDAYPLCAYTKPSDWNGTSLGNCSTNPCTPTQLCDPDQTNEPSPCTAIACGEPSPVAHATYRPANNVTDIGLKVAYFCNHGFVPRGNPSVTCLGNGTWSDTDFQCMKSCPPPLLLDNALVTRVDHSEYGFYGYGTVLHIDCKPGFVKMTASEITSTCSVNERWSVRDIPCCKPGYGFLARNPWESSCYILHDDVFLNTRQEMVDFCTNKSNTSELFFGKQVQRDLQITKTIFQRKSTTLNYIIARLQTTELKQNLLNCIKRSEVQIQKHDKQRKENIKQLISEQDETWNVTGQSYANLTAFLSQSGKIKEHYNFRLTDVKNRLNLISGLNVSQSSNYEELYDKLQNQTIDHRDQTDKTYTELAYIIRNNSYLMPSCTNELQFWKEGHPNDEGDCVVTGPLSNFTLINVPCNITDRVPANSSVGFVCWESRRSIQ